MVDTYVSGAYGEIRVGSSPIQDIIYLSEKSDRYIAKACSKLNEIWWIEVFGRSFRLQYKVWKTNKWIIKNAPSF